MKFLLRKFNTESFCTYNHERTYYHRPYNHISVYTKYGIISLGSIKYVATIPVGQKLSIVHQVKSSKVVTLCFLKQNQQFSFPFSLTNPAFIVLMKLNFGVTPVMQ